MQASHVANTAVAHFDAPNIVPPAGLLPVMRLAEKAGLRRLADQWLSIPTDKGANAGTKVEPLGGGMVDGADSIDDIVTRGKLQPLVPATTPQYSGMAALAKRFREMWAEEQNTRKANPGSIRPRRTLVLIEPTYFRNVYNLGCQNQRRSHLRKN